MNQESSKKNRQKSQDANEDALCYKEKYFFFLKACVLFKLNEMKEVVQNEIMNKAHNSVVQNAKSGNKHSCHKYGKLQLARSSANHTCYWKYILILLKWDASLDLQ